MDKKKISSIDLLDELKNNYVNGKENINMIDCELVDDEDKEDYCKNCNTDKVIQIDGYYTCKLCGSQLTSVIDNSQEWRYYGQFDNKSDPSRCGMPINELIPEISMGSIMALSNNDSYGTRRIRKIQTWNSITYKESTLIKSFNNITNVSNNNDINPCIIEEAKIMFKKVYEISCKKTKKNSMEAASLQLACKIKGYPRNTNEMAKMFGISTRDMRKGANNFEELWRVISDREKKENNANYDDYNSDDNINDMNDDVKYYEPNSSLASLRRSCSRLGLSESIFEVCKDICIYVEDNKCLYKHIPSSRTAGCIYFTCNMLNVNINKINVGKVCQVSEVTISKCFQILLKFKDDIIRNTKLDSHIKIN